MKGLQLPLGVQLPDTASFASFHAGPNADTVEAIRTAATAPGLRFLYGPPASGKTHLLQALTRVAAGERRSAYVPLRQLHREGVPAADVTDGLDRVGLVCLDDVDAVSSDSAWNVALVRLLDRLRAQGASGVLSARAGPERLHHAMPDLRTRLAAGAVHGLKPLADPDRLSLLRERAQARGLELPPEAARHLLTHLPRDTGTLLAALDRLDRALLTAQRRLTLAFVQQWLKDSPPSHGRA